VTDQPTRVLLIEDNPGDADLVRLRLVEGNSGLDVSCVDRLSAGLTSMSEKPPAVVLLDLNLPDSRGEATFRSLLKNAPGVPVVVLSGHDDEELATNALHQGVQDYLVKGTFNSKQLACAMRYAIERQALRTSLDMSRKQQLQFKDQFLSHVSHELRTPLTSIHQFVTILLDGLAGPIPPEQRDHLETVLRSAQQLHSMIDDLLETTRVESGKIRIEPRCIAIAGVVEQASAMLQATAQAKNITLGVSIEDKIPLVQADPSRVLQVLINLIDNAIKFTPAEGSVQVRAYLVEADSASVYLSVTDSGRGISPESKALVFERLFQGTNAVDNSRKGLGLGLYIVQELVRLHGGRIWVESHPDHGSVFSFTLPLFSLSQILLPIITEQGHLRDALTLVRVDVAPQWEPGTGDWADTCNLCRELLRTCIVPAKDVLLPALETAPPGETFLIVASADVSGAEILTKRIREQLDRSPELKATASYKIATVPISLPPGGTKKPLEKLVQEVADGITALAQGALGGENPTPAEDQALTTGIDFATGK
jgi:sigma-B regulation protein RsbU (phosphoserine phosphatase)